MEDQSDCIRLDCLLITTRERIPTTFTDYAPYYGDVNLGRSTTWPQIGAPPFSAGSATPCLPTDNASQSAPEQLISEWLSHSSVFTYKRLYDVVHIQLNPSPKTHGNMSSNDVRPLLPAVPSCVHTSRMVPLRRLDRADLGALLLTRSPTPAPHLTVLTPST
jgi:hypothetical protein